MGNINNPLIKREELPGNRPCLRFTFKGYLDAQSALHAVENWRRQFRRIPGERIVLIWDCLQMEGYEQKARTVWTKALTEMKKQIASIWVITDSSLIKMGASVMALFSAIDIHIVRSEDALFKSLASSVPYVANVSQDTSQDNHPENTIF